ncbi:MAG: MarR family transcriptional regulator [Lachnospiraceae bacterium]|nr:MarR family transcriptional regulator [Butyrivibrio sp.]MBQ6903433.1 MarR family transcriptional regulator [Lachnospiraceae bacterium]
MTEGYESLKIGSQLCFPVYACAKEITRAYKPFLDKFDLTYTQYITMMVLWERGKVNVKTLGECLLLDSGTLTPVLKKLESKGYIIRGRSKSDERNLEVTITEQGEQLKEQALAIPQQMGACMNLQPEEMKTLYDLLYKLLTNVRQAG